MKTKASLKIIALLLLIALAVSLAGCAPKQAEYKVVKTKLSETGTIKLLDAYISIETEKDNEKAVVAALEAAAKQLSSEQPLNGIMFWVYDREGYAGDYPSLGTGEYAPDGDATQVGMYKPGEATNMKVTADILKKDWSLALTDREYEIYKAYRQEYLKGKGADGFGSVKYMENVYAAVEKQVSATKDEILAAVNRYSEWAESDLR